MSAIRDAGARPWLDAIQDKKRELKQLEDQLRAWQAFVDGRLVRCHFCGAEAAPEVVGVLTEQLRRTPQGPVEAHGWLGRVVDVTRGVYRGPRAHLCVP